MMISNNMGIAVQINEQILTKTKGYGEINISIPRGCYDIDKNHAPHQLHNDITGKLQVSAKGFVYNLGNRNQIWFKFLVLGTYLGLKGAAVACAEVIKNLFNSDERSPAVKDRHAGSSHLFRLSDIAWKAVVNSDQKAQFASIEKFALAEIKYNHPTPSDAMNMNRSKRFQKGSYYARCMQPLFHKSQLVPQRDKLESLLNEKDRFQSLKNAQVGLREGHILTKIICAISLLFDPLAGMREDEVDSKLNVIDTMIKESSKEQKNYKYSADKCSKYAIRAILDQNHYTFKQQCVKTEADVKCCGTQLYKAERICGCVYKVDCCAQRCWAMDCLGCFCCFWPAARRVVII
jgi:hypothetical protein